MPSNLSRTTERIGRIAAIIKEKEIDALLLLDLKNIRYLLGFTGSDGAALITGQESTLLVDGRYVTQARNEAKAATIFEYSDKIEALTALLGKGTFETIGIEAKAISYDFFLKLKKRNRKQRFRFLSSDEMDSLRAIKDGTEIGHLKRAVDFATTSFQAVLELIKPGASERDIAIELEYQMRKRGAEAISFDTIVASGPNSALPHAKPGLRRIESSDVLIIDWGAVSEGYHSDETCTLVVGQASYDFKKAYGLVKDAHERAIAAIKAGTTCAEVDRIARECIDKGDRGVYFSHGTGHGVGLDIHESPRLASRAPGVLEAGMVITVEPGIYIPERWGIRIEDLVIVTNDGCEKLSRISKSMLELN